MASAMAPALAGSQTAPSLALGSATMILRMVGKSLPTTGVPAARHSNSLLGDESRSFNVSPGFGNYADVRARHPAKQVRRWHRVEHMNPVGPGSGAGGQFQLFTLVTLTHQDEVNVFEALERDHLKEEFNAATFGQSAVIKHHRGIGWESARHHGSVWDARVVPIEGRGSYGRRPFALVDIYGPGSLRSHR